MVFCLHRESSLSESFTHNVTSQWKEDWWETESLFILSFVQYLALIICGKNNSRLWQIFKYEIM